MTKEEIVENKNNKLSLIGKGPVYLVRDNLICIDLHKVTDENLIISDFVEGIVSNMTLHTNNTIIKTIKFSNNIKFIEYKAFSKLLKLAEISDLTYVEEMDANYLFEYCTSLKNTPIFPDYIQEMSHTFHYCRELVDVVEIPSKVVCMESTFYYCDKLKRIPDLPESVTNISEILADCKSLVHAPRLGNNIKDMSYAFCGCKSLLKAPRIPYDVNNMLCAFYGCRSLLKKPMMPHNMSIKESQYRIFDECNFKY